MSPPHPFDTDGCGIRCMDRNWHQLQFRGEIGNACKKRGSVLGTTQTQPSGHSSISIFSVLPSSIKIGSPYHVIGRIQSHGFVQCYDRI
jgi:hypothetical protein